MFLDEFIETRTLMTGDGAMHRQRRFCCPVHGYFDLFVFPDAEIKHRKCSQSDKAAGAGLELPKVMKKAA